MMLKVVALPISTHVNRFVSSYTSVVCIGQNGLYDVVQIVLDVCGYCFAQVCIDKQCMKQHTRQLLKRVSVASKMQCMNVLVYVFNYCRLQYQ